MGIPSQRTTAWIGLLVGVGAAVALLASGAVPRGRAAPSTDLSLTLNRTAVLEVAPAGRVLSFRAAAPGARRRTVVSVRNTSGQAVRLRLSARTSAADLGRHVILRVVARRHTLFEGTVDDLRAWTSTRLRLASGARTRLALHVRMAGGPGAGLRGPRIDISLQLQARSEE